MRADLWSRSPAHFWGIAEDQFLIVDFMLRGIRIRAEATAILLCRLGWQSGPISF